MSDSDSDIQYDDMDPEGFDVAHGAMYKMAKEFHQNQSSESEDELANELDNLVYKKSELVKVGQKEALEAQGLGNEDEEGEGEWQLESDDEEIQEEGKKEDEEVKKKNFTDKMQTYDSDDNDLMGKLSKFEAQDVSFKTSLMRQNKNDAQKAVIVREQKKVMEAVLSQRMVIQKYFNKVNQLPQSEYYSKFKEDHVSAFEDLEEAIKSNLVELNDVCRLLGKRISISIPAIKPDGNIISSIDKNYQR